MSGIYIPLDSILALPVLGSCVPLGVGGDLSVLPGVATVVEVVGIPLPPTGTVKVQIMLT